MKSNDIKLSVIFDNECSCESLTSLWGFSCLVETADNTILFDTGSNGRVLLKNMQRKKLDINRVDTIFISHAHWDHIGGLDSILELNSNINIFVTTHVSKNLVRDLNTLSNGVTVIGDEPTEILPYIHSTGAMGEASEQSFIIDTEDGLIIIAGCAHSGIEAIVTRAKRVFDKEILLLLGGFHLFREEEKNIRETVKSIKNMGTKFVCPSHCTGERAKKLFEESFKENYIDGGVGVDIDFDNGVVTPPSKQTLQ
ncbi:MBL fold metallo-hydrolase [Sulfurovum sp. bin170]|uniref:MBL fold metallo-hydrolase n=1 Tax=Sulfurovum sp. bin170 TaxID=2695268 RepID=UPI0013E05CAA|nr:MBL fold metallo-hydrolase [Sulfurovum sp. bin170]NEW60905.1 MBL fold metallo-hydrolase [Sulfurovum sp. bin170]